LYAWRCFSSDEILSYLPERWRSRDDVHSCTDRLGEFHDICILMRLMQDDHFLLSADGRAGTLLEEIRQLWRQDKEEKLEQLRQLLIPAGGDGKENPLGAGNLNTESYELHVD
jgi:hypothetical protein